jgi:hypothetical protein
VPPADAAAHRRLDERGVLGEDRRVEAVRLPEHPEGAREVPDAVRRDDDDRHGRGVSASTSARSQPPVASTTTRAGASLASRATSRRRPAGVCGTRARRPLGCTCTSSVAFDTSTPTKRAVSAARGRRRQASDWARAAPRARQRRLR